MEGVRFLKNNSRQAWVCHVNSLSDDLRKEIRDCLVKICHGELKASKSKEIYAYKSTVREFLERYETKDESTKKGMIGELLSHVLILYKLKTMKSVGPYFNMEERSIKKGFDILLYNIENGNIVITEVKSGNVTRFDPDKTNSKLIELAKNDLKKRLNEKNVRIWLNAINGAMLTLKRGNIKNKIVDILEKIADETDQGIHSSKDKDVILVSVLYKDMDYKITLLNVNNKRKNIVREKLFNNLLVMSIQKETFERVELFLKNEAS